MIFLQHRRKFHVLKPCPPPSPLLLFGFLNHSLYMYIYIMYIHINILCTYILCIYVYTNKYIMHIYYVYYIYIYVYLYIYIYIYLYFYIYIYIYIYIYYTLFDHFEEGAILKGMEPSWMKLWFRSGKVLIEKCFI